MKEVVCYSQSPSNSHSSNSVCRTLESLEGCFAKCYHVSLGLGKWGVCVCLPR